MQGQVLSGETLYSDESTGMVVTQPWVKSRFHQYKLWLPYLLFNFSGPPVEPTGVIVAIQWHKMNEWNKLAQCKEYRRTSRYCLEWLQGISFNYTESYQRPRLLEVLEKVRQGLYTSDISDILGCSGLQLTESWICWLETLPSVVHHVNVGYRAFLIHAPQKVSSLHRVTVGPSQAACRLDWAQCQRSLGCRRSRVAFRKRRVDKENAPLPASLALGFLVRLRNILPFGSLHLHPHQVRPLKEYLYPRVWSSLSSCLAKHFSSLWLNLLGIYPSFLVFILLPCSQGGDGKYICCKDQGCICLSYVLNDVKLKVSYKDKTHVVFAWRV